MGSACLGQKGEDGFPATPSTASHSPLKLLQRFSSEVAKSCSSMGISVAPAPADTLEFMDVGPPHAHAQNGTELVR